MRKPTRTVKEVRVQYLLPHQLHAALKKRPLIFLPLAPLEWHGPHLALGTDAIIAGRAALAVAQKTGGVVLPTLYMDTERERPPAMLKSLGFREDEYIVGMDFPKARGLYKSFYFPEEVFALTVRAHIQQCINHSYRYIYLVNGHGAENHGEVLRRLCIEFSNRGDGIRVGCSIAAPPQKGEFQNIAHAGYEESSVMLFHDRRFVDLRQLPAKSKKMRYKDYSIVDSGGFDGQPGKGHAIPRNCDPRFETSIQTGRRYFRESVEEIVKNVRRLLKK